MSWPLKTSAIAIFLPSAQRISAFGVETVKGDIVTGEGLDEVRVRHEVAPLGAVG